MALQAATEDAGAVIARLALTLTELAGPTTYTGWPVTVPTTQLILINHLPITLAAGSAVESLPTQGLTHSCWKRVKFSPQTMTNLRQNCPMLAVTNCTLLLTRGKMRNA